MRVAINKMAEMGNLTGVGHYVRQLRRCLPSLMDRGDELTAFPRGWRWWMRRGLRAVGRLMRHGEQVASTASVLPPSTSLDGQSFSSRIARQARKLLDRVVEELVCGDVRGKDYDLYHEPNYIPLARLDLPTVTTICDLSPLLHPQWHPRSRVEWFERNFTAAVGRSEHFLAISEAGRREILRELGVAPERVTRTYLGPRPGMAPLPPDRVAPVLRRLRLPDNYLLHLGTLEPRKNLLMLLRAYCELDESLRRRSPLLLAGGWGWNTSELATYYHETARHRGVLHVGYLRDADLPAIYNGARALLFPSLYEGFGLPPIEMMACGGAVLASTADAVAEVAGGQAHLIDPHDEAGWRDAMRRLILDDAWVKRLRTGATAHASRFAWERCAVDTLAAYRRTLGQTMGIGRPLRRAS
jgi:alpha-1,3-rhamnosyl/mannosyltransferase